MPQALIVDSQAGLAAPGQKDYASYLQERYEFRFCTDAADDQDLEREYAFDVVVIEWELRGRPGGKSGPELFTALRQRRPDIPVVFVTRGRAVGSLGKRVRVHSRTTLILVPTDSQRFCDALSTVLDDGAGPGLEELLGAVNTSHPILRESLARITRARSEARLNILITGPTGIGKEHLALSIHRFMLGPTRDHRFFPVHLPAIAPNHLVSALFGHKKGSFTDAKEDHIGVFEAAEGGTVFLDEIGELAPDFYTKLLRVADPNKREYTRMGEEAKQRVFKGCIIAATRHDLRDHVTKGSFPEDLYHRLSAPHNLRLPTLQDRKECDFDRLVDFLLKRYAKGVHLSVEARSALREHEWKGNIRELESALNGATTQCHARNGTHIDLRDLPESVFTTMSPTTANWQQDLAAFLQRYDLDKPNKDEPNREYASLRQRLETWYDACVLPEARRNARSNHEAAQRVGMDRKTFEGRLKAAKEALGKPHLSSSECGPGTELAEL